MYAITVKLILFFKTLNVLKKTYFLFAIIKLLTHPSPLGKIRTRVARSELGFSPDVWFMVRCFDEFLLEVSIFSPHSFPCLSADPWHLPSRKSSPVSAADSSLSDLCPQKGQTASLAAFTGKGARSESRCHVGRSLRFLLTSIQPQRR